MGKKIPRVKCVECGEDLLYSPGSSDERKRIESAQWRDLQSPRTHDGELVPAHGACMAAASLEALDLATEDNFRVCEGGELLG